MKKLCNFWSLTMLLVMCMGVFSSCSKDDDEGGSNGMSGSGELILDGNKLTVYSMYCSYTTSRKNLYISALTEKQPTGIGLHVDWYGLDMNSLKVGDDLCKKATWFEFGYQTDSQDCFSKSDISVIIKDIDTSKNQITFEFKDINIKGTGLFGKPDETHIISGTITAKYVIDPLD